MRASAPAGRDRRTGPYRPDCPWVLLVAAAPVSDFVVQSFGRARPGLADASQRLSFWATCFFLLLPLAPSELAVVAPVDDAPVPVPPMLLVPEPVVPEAEPLPLVPERELPEVPEPEVPVLPDVPAEPLPLSPELLVSEPLVPEPLVPEPLVPEDPLLP
jgi:hypothetical protein